jgi:hypothetical protein
MHVGVCACACLCVHACACTQPRAIPNASGPQRSAIVARWGQQLPDMGAQRLHRPWLRPAPAPHLDNACPTLAGAATRPHLAPCSVEVYLCRQRNARKERVLGCSPDPRENRTRSCGRTARHVSRLRAREAGGEHACGLRMAWSMHGRAQAVRRLAGMRLPACSRMQLNAPTLLDIRAERNWSPLSHVSSTAAASLATTLMVTAGVGGCAAADGPAACARVAPGRRAPAWTPGTKLAGRRNDAHGMDAVLACSWDNCRGVDVIVTLLFVQRAS